MRPRCGGSRRRARVCAAAVLLLGLLAGFEHAFHVDFGIDEIPLHAPTASPSQGSTFVVRLSDVQPRREHAA